MELHDRKGLPVARAAAIERDLSGLNCLADVVRWGVQATPERSIINVVVQDEYTHDVVVDYGDGIFLVFDTT